MQMKPTETILSPKVVMVTTTKPNLENVTNLENHHTEGNKDNNQNKNKSRKKVSNYKSFVGRNGSGIHGNKISAINGNGLNGSNSVKNGSVWDKMRNRYKFKPKKTIPMDEEEGEKEHLATMTTTTTEKVFTVLPEGFKGFQKSSEEEEETSEGYAQLEAYESSKRAAAVANSKSAAAVTTVRSFPAAYKGYLLSSEATEAPLRHSVAAPEPPEPPPATVGGVFGTKMPPPSSIPASEPPGNSLGFSIELVEQVDEDEDAKRSTHRRRRIDQKRSREVNKTRKELIDRVSHHLEEKEAFRRVYNRRRSTPRPPPPPPVEVSTSIQMKESHAERQHINDQQKSEQWWQEGSFNGGSGGGMSSGDEHNKVKPLAAPLPSRRAYQVQGWTDQFEDDLSGAKALFPQSPFSSNYVFRPLRSSSSPFGTRDDQRRPAIASPKPTRAVDLQGAGSTPRAYSPLVAAAAAGDVLTGGSSGGHRAAPAAEDDGLSHPEHSPSLTDFLLAGPSLLRVDGSGGHVFGDRLAPEVKKRRKKGRVNVLSVGEIGLDGGSRLLLRTTTTTSTSTTTATTTTFSPLVVYKGKEDLLDVHHSKVNGLLASIRTTAGPKFHQQTQHPQRIQVSHLSRPVVKSLPPRRRKLPWGPPFKDVSPRPLLPTAAAAAVVLPSPILPEQGIRLPGLRPDPERFRPPHPLPTPTVRLKKTSLDHVGDKDDNDGNDNHNNRYGNNHAHLKDTRRQRKRAKSTRQRSRHIKAAPTRHSTNVDLSPSSGSYEMRSKDAYVSVTFPAKTNKVETDVKSASFAVSPRDRPGYDWTPTAAPPVASAGAPTPLRPSPSPSPRPSAPLTPTSRTLRKYSRLAKESRKRGKIEPTSAQPRLWKVQGGHSGAVAVPTTTPYT